ncbi:ERBB receptor feedback inhibitor 1 [Trichomycterus rosablanca]|uniref:ERBB receptor feedback inhibitor 1 n=1 Tax=Trichomycterus rosablanca TaxID=2290929 RepID=UPI002F3531CB
MASSRPYWDQHDEMNRMYFCFGADSTDHILRTHQQSSTSVGFERRMYTSSFHHDPSQLSSLQNQPEGDQVVPSFQKLSFSEQVPSYFSRRGSKPLPPLPDMGDLSSDEAADIEVEFFSSTSESQLLLPERSSKASAFQYGLPNRRSLRESGQINFAYCDGPQELERTNKLKCEREKVMKQERPQRRLCRSNSGPAASFKPPNLQNLQAHEKPEVPPRVPIPPRTRKTTGLDVDEPPAIPPRQPIFHRVQRAASPKNLPIYVNGVMPPTQSFAPNPKYVSKAQHRPANCEGLSAACTPCILPIMEDGKKASATHYFLLPRRPGYLDKYERFFKESDSEAVHSGC